MLYDVKTPKEYMDGLEDDWRKEKVIELRKMILSASDDIEEGIRYKMLSFQDKNGVFLQLNAQKNYVSLYVGNADKVDTDGRMLEGINRGKGCLRFKKSDNLSDPRIGEFITKAVEMWKKGEDIDC